MFDGVGCTIVDACQVCRRSVQMGAHVADVGAPAPQRWRQLSFLVQKLLATPWKVDVDWRPPVDMHLACRRLQFVDQEWVLCDEGPSPPQPADVPFPRFL